MRKCKIPVGKCTHPDKPCCMDCADRSCQFRCENHPKRCGQWIDAEPSAPRERPAAQKYDRAEMARLRAQKLSCREIAQRLGCSENTVSRALAKGRSHE